MPKNCSSDFEAIIDYVDSVFLNGTASEKTALKEKFALQDLKHDDDAGVAISSAIWAWQSIQQYSGYSQFFQMCDAIEGKGGNYTERGVGLEKALPNYAAWFTSEYLPGCKSSALFAFRMAREFHINVDFVDCDGYGYSDWAGENNVQCFDTYNPSWQAFNDWTPSSAVDRPWIWMTCNEPLFFWQT